jgi:hypothetical protein
MKPTVTNTTILLELEKLKESEIIETIENTKEFAGYTPQIMVLFFTAYVSLVVFILWISKVGFQLIIPISAFLEIIGILMIYSVARLAHITKTRLKLDIYENAVVVQNETLNLVEAAYSKGKRFNIYVKPCRSSVFWINRKHIGALFINNDYIGDFDHCDRLLVKLDSTLNSKITQETV